VHERIEEVEILPVEILARNEAFAREQPLLNVENLPVHFPIRTGVFSRTTGWVKAVR
jgi:ABC-type microcin C transport system duplicated ATPase subunit YejF